MGYLEALILGLIQGLTEFIPISSSGHLVIIPKLFGWQDFGMTFDVALHLGTVVALILFFWKDWVKIISQFCSHVFVKKPYSEMEEGGISGRMLIPIFIACIPAAIAGFLWDDIISSKLRSPHLVIIPMVIMALLMLLSEKMSKRIRKQDQMTYKDYIIIGLAQAMALFPGVSRSGATITAGLFLNLDRSAAARFSFLLSMPIIIGAAMLQFYKDFLKVGIAGHDLGAFLLGFIVAAVSGYAAIKFLMNYLQKRSLAVFAIYRIVFAILVLITYRP